MMNNRTFIFFLIAVLTISVIASNSAEPIVIPLTKFGSQGFADKKSVTLDGLKRATRAIELKYSGHHAGMEKRAMVTVDLMDSNDQFWESYVATISIGTPPQSIDLLIDTGSEVSWVKRKTTNSDFGFNPDDSNTIQRRQGSFNIFYSDGSPIGALYRDNITMSSMTIKNQDFAVLSEQEYQDVGLPFLGVLGLSWSPGISSPSADAKIFCFNLFNNNPFLEHIVGMFIGRASGESKLTFGGFDKERVSNPTYHRIIPNSERQRSVRPKTWTIRFDEVIINEHRVKISKNRAIIDTGTPLIYGPMDNIMEVYRHIPDYRCYAGPEDSPNPIISPDNDGIYCEYPCDKPISIDFNFNGNFYHISNQDFNLAKREFAHDYNELHIRNFGGHRDPFFNHDGRIDDFDNVDDSNLDEDIGVDFGNVGDFDGANFGDDVGTNFGQTDDYSGQNNYYRNEDDHEYCFGSFLISQAASQDGAWILGFLKNVYTIFDWANQQIGFSALVNA